MTRHLLRDVLFIALLLALMIACFVSPFKSFLPGMKPVTPTPAVIATLPPTPTASPTLPPLSASLSVNGTQWGSSTCYIGATEGSSRFSIGDMQDLGLNAYHIYGGMSRWEAQDDSKIYGTPTIAQIKANLNSINWTWWDTIMTSPPGGSDYWWVNASPEWPGNARTLFADLKSAGIRPILDLRNRDNNNTPSWAPDPPTTAADWNEWWEHVFALVYWLDVRNHYNVNDFEVQNEPDLPRQGWHGTQQQYELFVQYTNDALRYVYHTYLPGQTYHLYGPASLTSSSWPNVLMQQGVIDAIDIHDYSSNISTYVEKVHAWMNADGYANAPLWITEWGKSSENAYSSLPIGISLLNNLIRGSSPGNDYVYGSTIFALYDYATKVLGFIDANGKRRVDYYALRMGIRALQGCRPTYQSTASNKNLLAITTRNQDGSYSLLMTNQSRQQPYLVHTNLSALVLNGKGSLQRFDAQHQDTLDGTNQITNGQITLILPPDGAMLFTFAQSST